MNTSKLIKPALAFSLASLIIAGCSSDSTPTDSTNLEDNDIQTFTVDGIIVDPYIEGAILCEDLNKDAQCNEDEQLSSSSTANGVFSFDNNLTAGSHIIIKTQGMHLGKTYDIDISGVVAEDGSIDVVSPLTTFETKGLTTAQIAEILNNAASDAGVTWNLNSDDISANPISSGLLDKTISEISDEDLLNIQASLSSYGILKIMSGSEALSALSSTELYTSGMQGELYEISKVMIQNINSSLNTTTLNQIKAGIEQGKGMMTSYNVPSSMIDAGLPEPTIELIVKVAVSIIDRLAEIGYTTCNATGGDVTAALGEVANNQSQITSSAVTLGTQMYGLTYRNEMKNNFTGNYSAILDGIFASDSNMQVGYNAGENGYTTIRFDSSNNLVAQ